MLPDITPQTQFPEGRPNKNLSILLVQDFFTSRMPFPPPNQQHHLHRGVTAVIQRSYRNQKNAEERRTDRGLRQVHRLEDETHDGGHLYDLAAHQTQLLVVVQDGVHVLDPHSVDRPVEYDPLAVRRRQNRVFAERVRRYAVRPL